MNTFTLKLLALILELYRLYITKTHLSILVIIPYLFYSTDIIMGCPIEILRIDRMMNIVKNSRFSRPSKIVLIHMSFINMYANDFETHQNIVVTLDNFFLPFEATFQIHKAFINQRSIHHFCFNRSLTGGFNFIYFKIVIFTG